jgi:hypothetical protein
MLDMVVRHSDVPYLLDVVEVRFHALYCDFLL